MKRNKTETESCTYHGSQLLNENDMSDSSVYHFLSPSLIFALFVSRFRMYRRRHECVRESKLAAPAATKKRMEVSEGWVELKIGNTARNMKELRRDFGSPPSRIDAVQ